MPYGTYRIDHQPPWPPGDPNDPSNVHGELWYLASMTGQGWTLIAVVANPAGGWIYYWGAGAY